MTTRPRRAYSQLKKQEGKVIKVDRVGERRVGKVSLKTLKDIAREDYRREGFESPREFLREIDRFYGRRRVIDLDEEWTLVEFEEDRGRG